MNRIEKSLIQDSSLNTYLLMPDPIYIYVVVTFSLTHKGNYSIVLPIKSNVLSQ
jgi:hypothetical protein